MRERTTCMTFEQERKNNVFYLWHQRTKKTREEFDKLWEKANRDRSSFQFYTSTSKFVAAITAWTKSLQNAIIKHKRYNN